MLDGYDVYKYIEFAVFSLYLIFIFLSIHIWLAWRDIDKNELKITSFIDESFFKRNCAYVFSFSIFFIIHEFLEGLTIPYAMIYFEFFEMLALISLVLFAYGWYNVLKKRAYKKSLPLQLFNFTKH